MTETTNVIEFTPPMYLKYKPAAQFTGLPEKLLRRLVRENRIDHFFSGRTTYLSVNSLEKICTNGIVL